MISRRSVEMNKQEDRIEIINDDLKNLDKIFGKESIDAITVNPPYKKAGSGVTNDFDPKTISRHEVLCTLEEIVSKSAVVLKTGGSFYMINRVERLVDCLSVMRDKKLEPKRIRFIHPTAGKAPNLFMVEGKKGAKPFLKLEDPIYVYDDEGRYTCTIDDIYGL